MRITFLGTGGAVPTSTRDNTSLLIENGQELLLLDCPGAMIQKIFKSGYEPNQVSVIFITHLHTDHVYGLPSFVHSQMLENKQVKLLGSAETIDFCLQLLDLFHLRKEKILYRMDPQPLTPGLQIEVFPGLLVTGLPVPHHSSSMAFLIQTSEGKVLFSGDTPTSEALCRLAENIDCLIHDCSTPSRYFEAFPFLKSMHTNSLDLGLVAQKAKVKLLAPCHFFSDLDFSIMEIEREIRENYKGQLFLPEDFQVLEVGKK
jgi:ribonuclease Z